LNEPNREGPLTRPAPAASAALLTAALSGLLCLSACAPSPTPPPGDGASPQDSAADDAASEASATAEASAPQDATAPREDGGREDSGRDAARADGALVDARVADGSQDGARADGGDAGAGMDAARAMDAATVSDGATLDVRRIPIDSGCDVVPDRVITATDAAFGITIETFTALCDRAGGYVEIHPHCGGANSCKGFSYDEGVHTWTEHTCAGLNTCNGFSCVIP
jgi:hypothetical protein